MAPIVEARVCEYVDFSSFRQLHAICAPNVYPLQSCHNDAWPEDHAVCHDQLTGIPDLGTFDRSLWVHIL